MKKYLIFTIVLTISLLMTSCTTYHKLNGVDDYSEIVLEKGDEVRIALNDKSAMSFTVEKTDDKNIYAKNSSLVVNKKQIKSIELRRRDRWQGLKAYILLIIGSYLSAP